MSDLMIGSGIQAPGPRMIMQERAAREAARQKAEAEQLALERGRAEQEARLIEEARRRTEHRQDTHQHADPRLGQAYAGPAQPHHIPGATAHAQSSHIPPGQASPLHAPPVQGSQKPTATAAAAEARAGESTAHGAADASKPKNAFPHAFERWEILSAHWEGLTSYWIRKLEQNKEEISRDPLSQQLARQVTDLSAAGANLFHAVVELQRLRASSERKFQRWFFETRTELERAHEVNAMLEAALERERRNRDQAVQEAVDHERGVSKTQKQIVEMRKELSISKEEARRAWEELGRREQEERDRTFSLQSGHPTIVGGVQVVPMTQNAPSRHASTRDPGTYQSDYSTRPAYSIDQQAAQAAAHAQAQASPARSGGAGGGSTSSLPHHGAGHQDPSRPSAAGSESGYSEDDYDTPATTNPPSGGFEPTSSSHSQAQWTGGPSQDYTGQGYGGTGWEAVPRHHHPTRLSDVIEEEDERSRTSGSQRRG
ncbi:hypothetical protein ESCO_004156 [Escovopsis weberi]|uniref:Uncharacterized protein n=1 Tax=Escovopsis weberi TaxID=150374 RepID=A0A0M8MWP6_ESCWE|nr:hypothetical protein ESCO_004156 [Escovopsis weberi]